MKVKQQHRNRAPKGEAQREGKAGAATSSSNTDRQSPRGAQVKDAQPGREFQGSGMLNKAGRFGSSTRPEELTDREGGGAQRKR